MTKTYLWKTGTQWSKVPAHSIKTNLIKMMLITYHKIYNTDHKPSSPTMQDSQSVTHSNRNLVKCTITQALQAQCRTKSRTCLANTKTKTSGTISLNPYANSLGTTSQTIDPVPQSVLGLVLLISQRPPLHLLKECTCTLDRVHQSRTLLRIGTAP